MIQNELFIVSREIHSTLPINECISLNSNIRDFIENLRSFNNFTSFISRICSYPIHGPHICDNVSQIP